MNAMRRRKSKRVAELRASEPIDREGILKQFEAFKPLQSDNAYLSSRGLIDGTLSDSRFSSLRENSLGDLVTPYRDKSVKKDRSIKVASR